MRCTLEDYKSTVTFRQNIIKSITQEVIDLLEDPNIFTHTAHNTVTNIYQIIESHSSTNYLSLKTEALILSRN